MKARVEYRRSMYAWCVFGDEVIIGIYDSEKKARRKAREWETIHNVLNAIFG